jgi:hypothetical protein
MRPPELGVLDSVSMAEVVAGSYCAVESVVTVNDLPFHLRWLREDVGGTEREGLWLEAALEASFVGCAR